MKKIKQFMMTMVILIGIVVSSLIPAYATTGDGAQNEETVTRLEWLKALTTAFEMEVEEYNYPDNYFSDVDASSEDYYDIMLATEFGLVDVEAGDDGLHRRCHHHSAQLAPRRREARLVINTDCFLPDALASEFHLLRPPETS